MGITAFHTTNTAETYTVVYNVHGGIGQPGPQIKKITGAILIIMAEWLQASRQ